MDIWVLWIEPWEAKQRGWRAIVTHNTQESVMSDLHTLMLIRTFKGFTSAQNLSNVSQMSVKTVSVTDTFCMKLKICREIQKTASTESCRRWCMSRVCREWRKSSQRWQGWWWKTGWPTWSAGSRWIWAERTCSHPRPESSRSCRICSLGSSNTKERRAR